MQKKSFTNIMIDHNTRIQAFVKLGDFFREFCEFAKENSTFTTNTNSWANELYRIIAACKHHNGWFTEENVLLSIANWADLLTKDQLTNWLNNYNLELNKKKNVALIMAGNIPLVGFHDFLSVLITGNAVTIKLSSNDKTLLPFIAKYLIHMEESLKDEIKFLDTKLENFDAVIATGSNNSARYFEHYFSKKPNLIRKNRNSVAVLTGKETKEQLKALGHDIFNYYGLGCRSVSKFFVPENYDFDQFFTAIYSYNPIINQAKYANNYDYNKAVYLMSEFKLLDNGFLLLKEDPSYSSPIATIFYEKYTSIETLKTKLEIDKDLLQCVVSSNLSSSEISFGETQKPELWNYADNIDTINFLLNAN